MKKLFILSFSLCMIQQGIAQSWQASGSNLYFNTGNVGIGTSTPVGRLDVRGGFNLNRPVGMIDDLSAIGIPTGSHLGFAPSDMSASNNSYILFSFPNNNVFRIGTGYDGNLGTGTYRDLQFGRYDNPYMTIKDGGNVGIGTTTPQGKLDVKGNVYLNRPAGIIDQTSVIGIPNGGYFAFAPSDMSTSNNSYMLFSFPSSTSFRIGTDYDGNINQGTLRDIELGTHFGAPTLTVKRDGNVGIGTTAPGDFKLAVEGKIGAREVKVTLASWADYVFNKDYNLMSLASLEAFIKKNHHLPNIPSEQEVKESGGIELGEMNRKLLEKIEELTLYVIELKKENEEIKKEMAEIKKSK